MYKESRGQMSIITDNDYDLYQVAEVDEKGPSIEGTYSYIHNYYNTLKCVLICQ